MTIIYPKEPLEGTVRDMAVLILIEPLGTSCTGFGVSANLGGSAGLLTSFG
jgi:hypothetical protein